MQQQQESGGEESWLEEQYHREIHGQQDEYEREYVRQRDNNLSTVYGAFQDSATAVAQLYRGKCCSSGQRPGDIGIGILPKASPLSRASSGLEKKRKSKREENRTEPTIFHAFQQNFC